MFLLLWLFLFGEPQKRIRESPPLTSTQQQQPQSMRYWFPVGACDRFTPSLNWSTPPTNGAIPICTPIGAGMQFPDDGTYTAHKTILLSDDFVAGVQFRLFWTAPSTEGNVRWRFTVRCFGDGEEVSGDPLVSIGYVEALIFAPANSLHAGVSAPTGPPNCSPGKLMTFTLTREAQHVQDTAEVPVIVYGLEVRF